MQMNEIASHHLNRANQSKRVDSSDTGKKSDDEQWRRMMIRAKWNFPDQDGPTIQKHFLPNKIISISTTKRVVYEKNTCFLIYQMN